MCADVNHIHRWRCTFCDFPNKFVRDTCIHSINCCVLCKKNRITDNSIEVSLVTRVNPWIDVIWPKCDMHHDMYAGQIRYLTGEVNWSKGKIIEYVKKRLDSRHTLGFWKQRRRTKQKIYVAIFHKYISLPIEMIDHILEYILIHYD